MKFYVLYCNGFMGTGKYTTYEQAQAAANFRKQISGQDWKVREVIFP